MYREVSCFRPVATWVRPCERERGLRRFIHHQRLVFSSVPRMLNDSNGSVVPVPCWSQRSFGRREDCGDVRLTGNKAGAVIGTADPRKTASGQSRRSSTEPERRHSVLSRRMMVSGRLCSGCSPSLHRVELTLIAIKRSLARTASVPTEVSYARRSSRSGRSRPPRPIQ